MAVFASCGHHFIGGAAEGELLGRYSATSLEGRFSVRATLLLNFRSLFALCTGVSFDHTNKP